MPRTTVMNFESRAYDTGREIKEHELGIISYIRELGERNNVDLRRTDVLEAFGGEEGFLIKDKGEINKIFFEKFPSAEIVEQSSIGQSRGISKAQAFATSHFEALQRQDIAASENELFALRQSIQDTWRRNQGCIKEHEKEKAVLVELKKRTPNAGFLTTLPEAVDAGLLCDPSVLVHSTGRQMFYAWLPRPVVLDLKNPTAGIDITKHLGWFYLRYEPGLPPKWLPYRDNWHYEDWTHPHISGEGLLCYGALKEQAEVLTRTDVHAYVRMCVGILNSYNPGDAYCTLEQLRNHGHRMDPEEYDETYCHHVNTPPQEE